MGLDESVSKYFSKYIQSFWMINKEIANYPSMKFDSGGNNFDNIMKPLANEIMSKFLPQNKFLLKKFFWKEPEVNEVLSGY